MPLIPTGTIIFLFTDIKALAGILHNKKGGAERLRLLQTMKLFHMVEWYCDNRCVQRRVSEHVGGAVGDGVNATRANT